MLTPTSVKSEIDNALKIKVAEAILDGGDTTSVTVLRKVVARIPDDVIEEILSELFAEAVQKYNAGNR